MMAVRRDQCEDITAFLAGDRVAHDALRREIRFVIQAFRFPADTREDLVQETLCRVFSNLRAGAFRGEASLGTYARQVGRYVCLEHLRRRRVTAGVDPAVLAARGASGDPEAVLLRAEEHQRNLKRLEEMPADCRHLFRLIFIEGLGYASVAERLGISLNAVKLRVRRCRLTWREPEEARLAPVDRLRASLLQPHRRETDE
jgi:RNA polymerase sigma factor (sigma-70 family)